MVRRASAGGGTIIPRGRGMQDCGIWDSCQIDEDRSSAVGRQWHVLIAEVTAFLTCARWGITYAGLDRRGRGRGRGRGRVVRRSGSYLEVASVDSDHMLDSEESEDSRPRPIAGMPRSVSDVRQAAWLAAKFRGGHPRALGPRYSTGTNRCAAVIAERDDDRVLASSESMRPSCGSRENAHGTPLRGSLPEASPAPRPCQMCQACKEATHPSERLPYCA
jgi:hypothetical protein